MVENMEVIANDKIIKISNLKIYENYIVKEYHNRYKFVKVIVENEISINKKLKKLGLVYVPKLLSIKQNDKFIKLYFEKIEGRTLGNVKFVYMKFEEKYRLFFKILNLIKLLHMNNIVHNDLKMSNIILNYDKEIYLIDFALSTLKDEANCKYDLQDLTAIAEKIFEKKVIISANTIHGYIKKVNEIKYYLSNS